ncbi:MAG TPA: hypothetical protein VFV24_01510, partial [Candidatus Eisenbacteria bacterium]|nr:hypothetical protein [Candidatus Eisenbacteria bacterium]
MPHWNRLRARAVAGLAWLCLLGPAPAASPLGHSSNTKPSAAALDDELKDLAAFGFSGAVLVSDREFGRLHAGYGTLVDGTSITPRTLFDIASLSKQFTAAG